MPSSHASNQNDLPPDYDRARPPSLFALDPREAERTFRRPVDRAEDLFSTSINIPGAPSITVPTHYEPAASPLRLIAYDDLLGWRQTDIARFFAPGEVFICVKHHKPSHPDLASAGKEAIKFDATHIGIGVGVASNGGRGTPSAGAVTLNNPQAYQAGLFGTADYPMIFLKLVFPSNFDAATKRQYVDNIRTWLVIANTYTVFPGNYNGGDPLCTRTVRQVEEFGRMLLDALLGTRQEAEQALAWIRQPAHHVYCAELAHLAVNLGLHVPLNGSSLGGRMDRLAAQLASKAFLAANENAEAARVELTMAPNSLLPITQQLGVQPSDEADGEFGDYMALRPFTVADMVEYFVRDHLPRRRLGEASAPAQAELLRMVKPGLVEAMGLESMTANDPKRLAAEQLFDKIVTYVGTPASDYNSFRSGLEPLLDQARRLTGPRPDGSGAFMPPHAWLLHALGRANNSGGILGVEIVGYGLHRSMLRPLQ